MTDINQTRRAPVGAGVFANIRQMFIVFSDWKDMRATRRALQNLTDAQLDDIGLCRGDIELIKN